MASANIIIHFVEMSGEERNISDWATIKSTIKNELGQFIYRNTKKNPMILPIIMEIWPNTKTCRIPYRVQQAFFI